MTKTNTPLSLAQLKMLLTAIVDNKLKTCIRYRLIGQMWQQNHMRVLKVTENGVLLNDETTNRLVTIRDLSHIMQFEIDSALYQYEPNYHYEVNPYVK